MTMTEHEKLLAGQDYDYRDPELQNMLSNGRKLIGQLNQTTDLSQKNDIIKQLFNKVGQGLTINGHFEAIYGKHISFGNDDFINGNCFFQDSNLITFGDRVIVAPDTKFYCGQHSLDATKRFGTRADGSRYLITYTKSISVGNDVWIGGNVTVIGGVHIGNNVIVGSGAVVVKDVPDNSVVGGVPAKVIEQLKPLQ
ncbi:sugar O-acetyltransferase [Companilactobacillus nantensis]|uniref:Hexapeptide repeat-containing transferase n=1 Tax=Companilactobacillus nantensis DSM 16982 TaxID=1423774 RepID=A0A0R1WLC8_9LACO|nr:sugar O-acetyltransferase [Companilactobacillus nantensis]KRM18688.1 hexapeptide repeat-containing transferase [Companilactobacillus nantensis DSM 16982]GEO63123.1 maltose O-acetyltransferase [Companilactobacillus nantensis]